MAAVRSVTPRRHELLDCALYALTAACLALLAWLATEPIQFRFEAAPDAITHSGGFAYIMKAPRPQGAASLLSFRADRPGGYASRLTVTENGRPLPWPHERIEDLRDLGAGRYLHWRGHLYFSALDNSDPRVSGKSYEATSALYAPWWMKILAVLLVLVSTARFLSDRPREKALVRPWADALFWPSAARIDPASAALLGVFAIAVGAICMAVMWSGGESTSTSLAGYFPISDGKGHHECTAALIDLGRNEEWCHRRPIYSVFLAGLYVTVGRDLGLLYIAQAALVLAAGGVLAKEISRWLGLAGAIAFLFALLLFSWKWVFGQTMTEVFGLTVGLLGQAVLLRAAESRSLVAVGLGVFLVSAALSARPGAVFTLGFVALWALVLGWPSRRSAVLHGGMAIGGALAGVALHSLCMIVVHGDQGGSFGNFSLTLYGLSVGRGWNAAIIDHPELIADNAGNYAAYYRLAWENFLANPEILVRGMWDNFSFYVVSLWNHWLPVRSAALMVVLFAASVAVVASQANISRRALLVLAFVLGEAASSLLIARDAEPRVWSATIGLAQIAPLLLALTVFARSLSKRVVQAAGRPLIASAPPFPRGAAAISAFIAALMAMTASGVARSREQPLSAPACAAGLTPHVVTAGKHAVLLTVDAAGRPQMWPRRISLEALIRGVRPDSWYRRDLHGFGAMQLIHADPAVGVAATALYAPLSFVFQPGVRTAVCAETTKTISVAGAPYARIISATPLR